MADYMREIIYLKKIANGIPVSNGGFVRLTKRGERVSVYLALKEMNLPSEKAVYIIYERNGVLLPFPAGTTGKGETTELELQPGQFQEKIASEEICGILIGEASCYWTGVCARYHGEIAYEQVHFAPEQKREEKWEKKPEEKPEEKSEEKQEEKPEELKAEAASLEGLPAQEPEKQRDPFFNKLAEMYPFEDDEMEWCMQMEPADFSSFPMEFWHYAKNSFLLQGFYNYRHLLYAHSKDKNYIGVPGQFHRREQYLANRFGFPRFKGTQKKRVTVGDFGYWLKEL